MIVKIQPPHANVLAAVEYNEKKMDGKEGIRDHQDESLHGIEDGHVLATRNVPDGMKLSDVLTEYKWMAKKNSRRDLKAFAFHMSINPSETDAPLTERQAVALADDIMKALGYARQPYRIYEHNDILRRHFHVVSCRVDENGKKIKDSFERLVLREALKNLAEKYGFTLVLTEEEERKNKTRELKHPEENKADTERERDSKTLVPPFSRESSLPVMKQMENICADVRKWHFSTFEQIQALMIRRYNILAAIERGTRDTDRIVLYGTDENGNKITPPVSEDDLGIELARIFREQADKEKMKYRREQKERIEKLAKAAAAAAINYDDFLAKMNQKGTIFVVSWTREGEPFGITYIDRATRCIWKGSETAVNMKWFKETAAQNKWVITMDNQQKTARQENNAPSRRGEFTYQEPAIDIKAPADGDRGKPFPPTKGKTHSKGNVRVPDKNRHSGMDITHRGGRDDVWDNRDEKQAELIK